MCSINIWRTQSSRQAKQMWTIKHSWSWISLRQVWICKLELRNHHEQLSSRTFRRLEQAWSRVSWKRYNVDNKCTSTGDLNPEDKLNLSQTERQNITKIVRQYWESVIWYIDTIHLHKLMQTRRPWLLNLKFESSKELMQLILKQTSWVTFA